MSKRDSKGRFVSSGNNGSFRYRGACKSNKCTCKEAKRSMEEKKRATLGKEASNWINPETGTAIVAGYEVPINPEFLEFYLNAMALAYPDNVRMTYSNEDDDIIEDFEDYEEPDVVFCFGEDPCEDDPDAPKPVWAPGTHVIHIDPKNNKTWVEKAGEKESSEDGGKDKALEHFRRLKAASEKLKKGCIKAAPVAAAAVFPKEAALIMAAVKFLKELEKLKEK